MKFPVWPFRVLILAYFVYKMFLIQPPFIGPSVLNFEGESEGRIAGRIIVLIVVAFIPGLFYYYHIKQGINEIKRMEPVKVKYRLYSIIFSMFFFFLAAGSLLNLDFSRVTFVSYVFNFYNAFTFLSAIAAGFVIVEDVKLFRSTSVKLG